MDISYQWFVQAFGVEVFDFTFYHLPFFALTSIDEGKSEEREMVKVEIKDFYPECLHKNGTIIIHYIR